MLKIQNGSRLSLRLAELKSTVGFVFILGIILNILSFTSPLFMMQIMDSIIPSQDKNTLILFLGFGALAFALMSWIEVIRKNLVAKTAIWLEAQLAGDVLEFGLQERTVNTAQLGDVRQISSFIRSGATILIDAPFAALSFAILWLIQPAFVVLALFAGAVILIISFIGSAVVKKDLNEASATRKHALSLADALAESGSFGHSMGISENVLRVFKDNYGNSLSKDIYGSGQQEMYGGASRFIRQSTQIIALTMGAFFVMNGSISGGAMIAGSIILAKALLPFDQLSSAWASMQSAHAALVRFSEAINSNTDHTNFGKIIPDKIKPILNISNITVPRGKGAKPILERINFDLHPGECVAIVGPSGAGKSTLVEIIAGLRRAPMGEISIDGVPFDQISPDDFSQIVGYAPQSTFLFPGTITENISRFSSAAERLDILDAVKRSETEHLIRETPAGFDTRITNVKGHPLSAGNARRLTLARALYGRPKLLIFDEPASDLDEAGEKALVSLISRLKSEGAAVILIAQRAGLISVADKIMSLDNGRLRDFGDRSEVLARLSLRRRQIDLTPHLDEIARLSNWLDIQLSRREDVALRDRAETVLVEIFNQLRIRPDIDANENISITVGYIDEGVEFSFFCGAESKLNLCQQEDAHSEDGFPKSLSSLSEEELSRIIVFSAAAEITETFENDRLKITVQINYNENSPTEILQQAAI